MQLFIYHSRKERERDGESRERKMGKNRKSEGGDIDRKERERGRERGGERERGRERDRGKERERDR